MGKPPLILFESGLGVIVLAWAFWELWSLRRDRKRREREAPGQDDSPPSSPP